MANNNSYNTSFFNHYNNSYNTSFFNNNNNNNHGNDVNDSNNDNNHDSNHNDNGAIVSEEVVYWFHVLAFFAVNCPISLVGMGANVVNIVVFLRQGPLSDSSNMTLLGLAFADFWCLLTIFMTGVFFLIFQEGPESINWDPQGVMLMSAGWPHVMFSQIACWIQAYLAFERCICVSYPFKVRTLFSAKKSLLIVVFIFVFTILFYSPVYATHPLGWVNIPAINRTIYTIDYHPYNKIVRDTSNYFNSLFCRTVSISIVIICTQITVFKVNLSNKWRQSAASSNTTGSTTTNEAKTQTPHQNADTICKQDRTRITTNKDCSKGSGISGNGNGDAKVGQSSQKHNSMSQKDRRMVRMVTIISIIFLICYTPDILMVFTRSAVSTLHFGAKHHNLMILIYWGSFFSEAINSSINILVYYRLSSRYKEQFRKLFGLTG